MPVLFIQVTNSRYHSRDQGAEYKRSEDALASGIQSAVAIIADEINGGERSAAVEVSIEWENGIQLLRSVVATSVSPLVPRTEASPSAALCERKHQ